MKYAVSVQWGLLLGVVFTAFPGVESVFAADTLGKIADDLTIGGSSQFAGVPGFISGICYIAGIGLCLGGANKLKEHADKPFDSKVSPALVRLAAGGAALSLPSLATWLLKSLSLGANYSGGTKTIHVLTN